MKHKATCPECKHKFDVEIETQQKRAVEARWEKVRAGKGGKAAKKKAAKKAAKKRPAPVAPAPAKVDSFACGLCGTEHATPELMKECMAKCMKNPPQQ